MRETSPKELFVLRIIIIEEFIMDGKIVVAVILSVILGAGLGFGLSCVVFQLSPEPCIHSQLLGYPPAEIPAYTRVEDWVLDWTPKTDVRIIRIQVWMGNPADVMWEGDTFVTIGRPSNPWNSSSYTNAIQLLVHYQFDSHAPSSIPHQVMFDLTPGFKVASGQTINVYRLFVSVESRPVTAVPAFDAFLLHETSSRVQDSYIEDLSTKLIIRRLLE